MSAVKPDHSSGSSHEKVHDKKQYDEYPQEVHSHEHVDNDVESPDSQLHRGLKARQITMIAIGGAIGTGLIIGT